MSRVRGAPFFSVSPYFSLSVCYICVVARQSIAFFSGRRDCVSALRGVTLRRAVFWGGGLGWVSFTLMLDFLLIFVCVHEYFKNIL